MCQDNAMGPLQTPVVVGRDSRRPALPCQTEAWTLHSVTPRFHKDHRWRIGNAQGKEEGWDLKGFHHVKLKRHYLLTWRCPLWDCTQWCKKKESEWVSVCVRKRKGGGEYKKRERHRKWERARQKEKERRGPSEPSGRKIIWTRKQVVVMFVRRQ